MSQDNDKVTDLPADLQAEADFLLADAPTTDAPRTDQGADQANTPDTAAMLAGVLGITFNAVIAPRRGAHWNMSETECVELGKAYGAVIDKYFPDLDVGVEFTAIVVTFTVLGPRIAQDIANAADQSTDTPTDPDDGERQEAA